MLLAHGRPHEIIVRISIDFKIGHVIMVRKILRLIFLLFALPAFAQEPLLARVLSAVTLSFSQNGETDRAVLVENDDAGADLYIYLNLDPANSKGVVKPALVKKNAAWSGAMWGSRPSLDVNEKGSLLVKSANEAIGRDRWSQTLTVAYRNKEFVAAGLTREARDTLDPKAGGSCELNFLSGKGKRNGKAVEIPSRPITLAEWSDERLPKECAF
jgi:hypothetical protein